MSRVSFAAVLVGAITDIVASAVVGIPFGIYVVSSRGLSGLPKAQLKTALTAAIHASTGLYTTEILIGLVCSVCGGYVAARLAKHDEVLNGLLASWLCVAIGLYSLATGRTSEPVPIHLLTIATTPLCYLLGAYLRLTAVRARSTAITTTA